MSQQKSATEEEIYNAMKNIALNQGKVMRIADWTSAYNYAWRKNLIVRLNEKERKDYKAKVIEALKSEERGQLRGSSRPISEIINDNNSIQAECHRRILQAHFQEMIDNKEK